MGIVYAAEQREPVRRTVALKVLRPDRSSEQALARFQVQRQALAVMDHPSSFRSGSRRTLSASSECARVTSTSGTPRI